MTRRQFALAAGAASLLRGAASPRHFYFGVIADTHILDELYVPPANPTPEVETLQHTTPRLTAARDFLNKLNPPLEQMFLVGDYFHDYPSTDWDYYFKNKTRVDHAKAITDGFHMPFHAGFGNHDYDEPRISRKFSHDLFREKFGLKPYYAVEHKGWKFVHLNNFLGATWDPKSPAFKKSTGSLGVEQLEWFEAQLREHKPTFVFVHFPLMAVMAKEQRDFGLLPLLDRYKDTIQRVVSGHAHVWMDFGRSFGPEHWVMGATRFDEDAYLIVEADTVAMTHKILNIKEIDWSTHFSRPYQPG